MKATFVPCFVGVLSLSLMAASPAGADIVTVEVTGHVTYSDFATIAENSPVTGYYRYDDALEDRYPGGYGGDYAPITFSLTFVGDSTISSNAARIGTVNNSGGMGTLDEYFVAFPSDSSANPDPRPNVLTGVFAGLAVDEGTQSGIYRNNYGAADAWDTDALPDPESILAALPNDYSHLTFGTWVSFESLELIWPPYYDLRFEVTGLSVVPVPGAFVLGSLGLGSAGWLVRRRNGSV